MGATERATFSISSRYTVDKSILMDWKNRRCRVDIFALVGKCGNPQDFSDGGEKWTYFPDGEISGHSLENFGAFDRSENNPTNDMVPMTSEEYYELLKMRQETNTEPSPHRPSAKAKITSSDLPPPLRISVHAFNI